MTIKELFEALPRYIALNLYEKDDRAFISTCFLYPNGDRVAVYFEEFMRSHGAYIALSDKGTTFYNFAVEGLKETPRRTDVIKGVCALHGLQEPGEELKIESTDDSVVRDFISLCQAICKISTLQYEGRDE